MKRGHYTSWFENGQKCIECDYVNGMKHGHYTSWYEMAKRIMNVIISMIKKMDILLNGMKMVKYTVNLIM